MKPTSAFVLAAGYGQRMRPLTDHSPKPLVKLGDKPLLDHVLDRLAAAGVTDAVVNVHYLADQIEQHVAMRRAPRIVISDERATLLDTGGGVKKALQHFGDTGFFVHNSDSVWIEGSTAALDRLTERWDPERMDALLLLAGANKSVGYSGAGDFSMGSDGRLHRPAKSEVVPFVFAGVSIIHPRLLDDMPDGAFSLNLPWDRAIEAGRVFGLRHDGIWMHVGTPEALIEAERCLEGDDIAE